MTKFAILVAIAAVSVCVQSLAAVADEVPTFDVRKNCKADVQAYPSAGSVASCLANEENARKNLVIQWTQFAPESRARCVKVENDVAGDQSYVELLSCLQMAKDVKTLPKE